MYKKITLKKLFLLMFVLTIVSCSSDSKIKKIKAKSISPEFARIICTVVQIDSVLDTRKPNSPCGKVPCYTVVKIDSILGYGSAFGKPLHQDENIDLKFIFTTNQTSGELFPNIDKQFPGVSSGVQITGDIQQVKYLNTNTEPKKSSLYKIYEYQIINK